MLPDDAAANCSNRRQSSLVDRSGSESPVGSDRSEPEDRRLVREDSNDIGAAPDLLGHPLEPFERCALTVDAHRDLVVNAITERLSNVRLEGMNSTVRLLRHRARGYRRLSLLAMITLVCGRVPVRLPT